MSVLIRPVFGFGSYPDGRLRAGPFNLRNPTDIHLALKRHMLRPGCEGDAGMVSAMSDGVYLSSSGAGVRGYFLDDEGLEAAASDLDSFVIESVHRGRACTLSGHWSPDPDRTIISEAVAVHDGALVSWIRSRIIRFRDGSQTVIEKPRPVALDMRYGAG